MSTITIKDAMEFAAQFPRVASQDNFKVRLMLRGIDPRVGSDVNGAQLSACHIL